MPRGRRPATTINCTHCGRDGHSSNICPRDDYSSDLPSLTCSQCVRTVGTARGGDNTNQIYVGIQPCSLHSTLTSQPPSAAPTALSTALAPTAPAPPAAAPPAAAPAAAPVPHAAAPAPPATAPIPPATAAVAPAPAPLPFRTNRTNRMFSFADIDSKYRLVVSLVLGGATINDALEVAGIKRRTFRRWRVIAEARLLDEPGLNTLVGRTLNASMGDCELHSKTILNRSTSRVKLEELFRAGACLKPLKK